MKKKIIGYPSYPSAYCNVNGIMRLYLGEDLIHNELEKKEWLLGLKDHLELQSDPIFGALRREKSDHFPRFSIQQNNINNGTANVDPFPILGQIMAFPGQRTPGDAWFECDGSLLLRNEFTALFSLLGYNFGKHGDTSFGIPDLRGRSAIGIGSGSNLSPIHLAEKGGMERYTLRVDNLVPHTHDIRIRAFGKNGNENSPEAGLITTSDSISIKYTDDYNVEMKSDMAEMLEAGEDNPQSINLMPKSLAMSFYICVYGVYPSRN